MNLIKKIGVLFILILITINSEAQSIEEQLVNLDVFKEKVIYEWVAEEELNPKSPLVVVDRSIIHKRPKQIDPSKVKRIERLDPKLAEHLFGERSKNGVFKIVIDDETNNESYFKITTNPPYHSSCKDLENSKEKQKCSKDYLEEELSELIGNQQEFVLGISITFNGEIKEISVLKGESNKRLEEIFEKWKNQKYQWYPGQLRNAFVNYQLLYQHGKE